MGENRAYETNSAVYAPLPDWARSRNHTLVVRFLPLFADNCAVGYASAQGVWSVRMRDGKGIEVLDDGAGKAEGSERAGELHGTWRWYRRDGSLMRTGRFTRGTKVGTWETWDADGRLVSTKEH